MSDEKTMEVATYYAEDCDGMVMFTGGEITGDGVLIGEVSANVMLAMVSGKPQELLSEIIVGLPERVFEDFQSQLGTLSYLLNSGLPDDWRPKGWGCQDDCYKSPPPDFVMEAAEKFIKSITHFDRVAAWMLDGEFEDNPAGPDYGDSCEYAFLKAITTPEGRSVIFVATL